MGDPFRGAGGIPSAYLQAAWRQRQPGMVARGEAGLQAAAGYDDWGRMVLQRLPGQGVRLYRYDSADNRRLCLGQGIQPYIRQIGEAHGSGLGRVRSVVEHDCAWLLANKRLDRRHDRLGYIILALLTAACIFIVANRISPF